MKNVLLLLFIFQPLFCQATIHQVGSSQIYISPNSLYLANVTQDGDTIEIDAETYTGQAALAVWQSNDLFIKGVGGQANLIADGQYIWGKGIWVFSGNNISVENIIFSGAAVPDNNGAGIRLDGEGLTARYCYFYENENGILTSNPYAGEILIEFCEFANNGFGDGLSHNVYVGHVEKLTFRFNYSHHASIGHNLKSRANENFIYYNRIMDEETGNSSRLIDLPNGGFSIVMGNLFMQGENAPNNNLIGYGLEGLENTAPHEFYFVNNTVVNKKTTSGRFLHIQNGTAVANISNNIFAGIGTIVDGTATALNNNFTTENIGSLDFADETNYDYKLTENSPAIDYGTMLNPVNGYSLTPNSSYVHPLSVELRMNGNGLIDVGAYEFQQPISTENHLTEKMNIFPNPTRGLLNIGSEVSNINRVFVYDYLGRLVQTKSNIKTIDLSEIPAGIYFIKIQIAQETAIRQIIKL